MLLPPPRSTLFPYTTLFRSAPSRRTCSILPSRARGCSTFTRPSSARSEEHTSELQSRRDLVCRLLLEKKKKKIIYYHMYVYTLSFYNTREYSNINIITRLSI